MLFSVLPAVAGATLGYLYARYALPEATFRRLGGMYGGAGAAAGILSVRVAWIFRSIFADYFSKDDDQEG